MDGLEHPIKIVSKWSQNPWEIGPGTQQKTMLKSRAPKIKKYSKHDSKMEPKERIYFGGNANLGAFGGPNRFCDEKVGSQRCQSAPKARILHKPRLMEESTELWEGLNPFHNCTKNLQGA